MLIARWLFLLAALAIGVSVALFLWTGNRSYWRLAQRIFVTAAGAGVLFFAVLVLERLAVGL